MRTVATGYATDDPLLALLVDPDPDTRYIYAECLRRDGWHVVEASAGPEALAKAIARRPDIVVTDTSLPGFDGFALCDLLRQDRGTHDVPVVFVSDNADAADVEQAADAGANMVLTKACRPTQLLDAMHAAVVDSHRLPSPAHSTHHHVVERLGEASEPTGRAEAAAARLTLKKAHNRRSTVNPPIPPPVLVCSECDWQLDYLYSHIGGVSRKFAEQWDYFECRTGCGTFQYRVRTRKLRKLTERP